MDLLEVCGEHREAWEEKAAIIEHGGQVDDVMESGRRDVAERMAASAILGSDDVQVVKALRRAK